MDLLFAKSIIECLLFVSDTPVEVKSIKQVLEELDEREIRKILTELQMDYETQGRPLCITEVAEGFSIVTREQYAPFIKKLFKAKVTHRLSKAALETLAIVACKQPLTKLEIESLRGVSADGVLDTLYERKLIRIVGRKEVIGRPLLYGTTKDFLQYFGLKDLTELPKLEEVNQILGSQTWQTKNGRNEEKIKEQNSQAPLL
ncbi:MAG: SMC-Scp complex subunit ScpB [Candidatus Firestonebacteria bacterium]